MVRDLPKFRFSHAVHSDVTLTFVFFNNCLLKTVRLVQFKSKHFELVVICLHQQKNKTIVGNKCLITLPVAEFLCLSQS